MFCSITYYKFERKVFMYSTKSRLILVITVLLLVSLSCRAVSVRQDIFSVESTEVVSITPKPEINEAPPATEISSPPVATLPTLPPTRPGPDSLDLAQLPVDHGLSDFTENITVDMTWTDSEGVEQQQNTLFSHRQQSLPAFAWYTLYDDQNVFFVIPTKIETALVDGQAFSTSSDRGCNVLSVDLVNLDEQRQSFRDLIGALTGQVSKAEANVDLGEFTVDVYLLEAANLTPGAEVELEGKYIDAGGSSSSTSTTLILYDENVSLESGKLFLAQQGGFVARIELLYSKIADEEDSIFAQPDTRVERMLVYEVLPATELGDVITLPTACEATTSGGGAEGGGTAFESELKISDIPRIGEPTNAVETDENLVYFTSFSVADVVDFYKSELGALGWELEEEVSLGAVATLKFVLGNQTVHISIVETDDEVMVTAEIY